MLVFQPVKDEILRVLNLRETKAIDYWCLGLHVNAAFFDRVIAAVTDEKVHMIKNAGELARIGPPGAAASYDPVENGFNLPTIPCQPGHEEAIVVHEAVHCGQDIMWFKVPWYCNEAIAYIAYGVFLSQGRCASPPGAADFTLKALNIAENLPKGGEVPWGPFKDLFETIKYSRGYSGHLERYGDGPVASDGI